MIEAWLVWLVPIVGGLSVPLVGRFSAAACSKYAIAVSSLTGALGLYQALTFTTPYVQTIATWSIYSKISIGVQVDGLSVILSAFVSLISLVIVVYATGNMKHEGGQVRFYSLVLVFIGAMLGLVMAANLIQLYLFWEIVGICSALLIAFWTDKEQARRAGFKAFVVTRIGDIALLIAVVTVLVTLGTTDLNSVISAGSTSTNTVTWTVIGALILVGAMGKSAQVPLHVWLPDAMEGPTPVSALIHAATMVNAGVYLLVRMYPIYAAYPVLSSSVLVVGLISMMVGAICACASDDIKRVLAYSTISQLGLMFAAVGLGTWSGAIYQLISQGVFKALAFMAAGSVIEAIGTRNMQEMGGLASKMKYTYVAFLFAALAMAGIPPLIGFWTKELILSTAFSAAIGAFLVILLGSMFTSFYSFRALFKVFHGSPKNGEVRESGPLMVGAMITLIVAAIAGWLALGLQGVFIPSLTLSPDIVSTVVSVVSILGVILVCYVAFITKSKETIAFVQASRSLQLTKRILLEGMWFDRFYSLLVRSIVNPVIRLASKIQSGDLGNNVALLFGLLVVIILLAISIMV